MNSKISVYITSYNQKHYLVEAIESVLNQTLRPFEIVIVDDCSTDGSQEIIERYAQVYPDLVRPFYQERNVGVSKNRNFALRQVRGDLVTYLDGDDRFLPEKLAMESETLSNHPEAQIVYSNVHYIDAKGQRIGKWTHDDHPLPSGDVFREVFSRAFPRNSVFRNELVLCSCLEEVGFYDDGLATYEDWDLKIRLTKHFQAVYCPEPLTEYRLHLDSLSKLPASRHLNTIKGIYEKNRIWLEDLLEPERKAIQKRLARHFAKLAWRAAIQAASRGELRTALQYGQEFLRHDPKSPDFKFVAQMFFPQWACRWLKAMKRRFL